jgi:hypothetical protein
MNVFETKYMSLFENGIDEVNLRYHYKDKDFGYFS